MSDDHVSVGAFIMGLSFFPLGFGLKELVISEGSQTKGFLYMGVFLLLFLIYVVSEVHRRVKFTGEHNLGVTSGAPKNTWMWLFLASEVVFFTMLIGLSFALRLNVDPKFGMTGIGAGWLGHHASLANQGWTGDNGFSPEDLDIILTTVNTFLLITSSFTMVLAVEAAKEGDSKKTRNFLLLTALIGSTFLGIQVSEYTSLIVHESFTMSSGLFGATFYLQTGFHGAHVLVGILLLLLMAYKAHLGAFDDPANNDVEILGLYWHFVDLVWVVLFTLVYLL